jgi:hypothetical protein
VIITGTFSRDFDKNLRENFPSESAVAQYPPISTFIFVVALKTESLRIVPFKTRTLSQFPIIGLYLLKFGTNIIMNKKVENKKNTIG